MEFNIRKIPVCFIFKLHKESSFNEDSLCNFFAHFKDNQLKTYEYKEVEFKLIYYNIPVVIIY